MDQPPRSPGSAPMSPGEFRELGRRVVDWIADYWERVESMPVLSRVAPGEVMGALPACPPERGELGAGWDAVFGDLERIVLPGITHWQHPGFFAFFPANASGPAVLGELLSAGLGVQGMLWLTSPACTELEVRVLDWLAQMLALPAEFSSTSSGGGVIHGTASEATLTALVAGRARLDDDAGGACVYASDQAHSSVVKAAMIAGLARSAEDRARVRLIATDARGRLDAGELERALREDRRAGLCPAMVCATVGTTGTTAVDDVEAVGHAIARSCGGSRARPWLHVDAAHSGSACVCPEHRWMLRGIEHADSLCLNPHKWLLTNFDCDCFYVRDRSALVRAMSVTPEYLRNAASETGAVIDYRDWQVPLGRRFRALKLWLVIRYHGVEGLRTHIRGHVRLAQLAEALLAEDPALELPCERTLNLVCFRVRADADDARTRELLARLNATGEVYLTHTVLPASAGRAPGRMVLRLAIGGTWTQERHVRRAVELARKIAAELS